MSKQDLVRIVRSTTGYSASDLTALCREAALGPVRELGAAIASASLDSIRPVRLSDFSDALQVGVWCWNLVGVLSSGWALGWRCKYIVCIKIAWTKPWGECL